jgi:hypothetical protein
VILEKQELQDNKCQQQYKYTDKQTKLNIIYYNQHMLSYTTVTWQRMITMKTIHSNWSYEKFIISLYFVKYGFKNS